MDNIIAIMLLHKKDIFMPFMLKHFSVQNVSKKHYVLSVPLYATKKIWILRKEVYYFHTIQQ